MYIDRISDDKFLIVDSNYDKGIEYYKNKLLYLAGYPSTYGNQRVLSIGNIINRADEFSFEHNIKTEIGSSGSPICLRENLNLVGIHKQKNNRRPINYGAFIGDIIKEINNDEAFKIINEKQDKYIEIIEDEYNENSIDAIKEPLLVKELSKEELEFQEKISSWILFLSFVNFKLFSLAGIKVSSFAGFIDIKYLIKLFGIFIIYSTKNSFLLVFLVIQIIILFLYIFGLHIYIVGETKEDIIFYSFIIRNYIKDNFVYKLRKYNFYNSMIFFSKAEGYSNLLFLFAALLKTICSEKYYEYYLIIIILFTNILNYIILFCNYKKLKIIFQYKGRIENENDKICDNFIWKLSLVIILVFPLLLHSELYYKKNYIDLTIFLLVDFFGRIVILFKLNDFIWNLITNYFFLFHLIFSLLYNYIIPNYLTLILYSFSFGTTSSIIYNYNEIKGKILYPSFTAIYLCMPYE